MAQMIKNPPAVQENWVWSLGREDPLEKGTATRSSILAWRISWTEEPEGLTMGLQRVRHNWATNTHISFFLHPEYLTHWKRPWCWERLRAGGEGTTVDATVGWHHWHNGHGFGWTPGVGDGQRAWRAAVRGVAKESDTAEWLNWKMD